MNFAVEEVKTPQQAKAFIKLPVKIYAKDPVWIRPLDKDIEGVFHPKTNKYFRHGECTRWILKDGKGAVVGRIAAFIDKRTAKTFDQPTGGVGFFECIDDQAAAFTLFDTAKAWLADKGMEAMDGPINFGDRDRFWGLLVEGWLPPNYCCNYNPPYYQAFFEAYGFQEYFKQLTFGRPMQDEGVSERIHERASRVFNNPDYTYKYISKKRHKDFAEDFRTVYNKAWVKHEGVKEMTKAQAQNIMKKLLPIMDEDIMIFTYYKDAPVAFFLMLPDLNTAFKHVNGKMNLLGKLTFLYFKKFKKIKKAIGIAFGVAPQHQGKGVESAMILEYTKKAWRNKDFQYKDLEMNWIGDFNKKMIQLVRQVGGDVVKTHITYRKPFDPDKKVVRATEIS